MPAPDSMMSARLQVDAGNLHHVARLVDKSMGQAITRGVDHGMKESQKLIKRGLERAASTSDFAKRMFEARETRKQLVAFAGKVGDWFGEGYTKAQKVFFSEWDKYQKRRRRREQEHDDLMHERRRAAAQEIESFRRKELDEQIETYGKGMTGVLETLKSGELAGIAGLIGAAGRGGMMRGRAWMAAGEAEDAGKMQKALAGIGKGMAKIGVGIAAIGATAGVFAILLKLILEIFDAAAEVKKTFLEMGGAVAMGTTNVAALNKQMEDYYKTVYALGFRMEWLVSKEEIMGIARAMGEAGMNIARVKAEVGGAAQMMQNLQDQTKFALTYATLFGKRAEEIQRDVAGLAFETGSSMKVIYEGMASISEITRIAGFDVKRFYGTVLEVTSGMGMYSRRVEEAAGMLKTLSSILGETVGADFLKGLKASFKDMPFTERIKFVALAGHADLGSVFQDAAERQAVAVEENFKSMLAQDDRRAQAIVDAFGGTADNIAETIASMTDPEFREAQAAVLAKGIPGAAEQLQELTRLRGLQQAAAKPAEEAAKNLQHLGPMHTSIAKLLVALRPVGGLDADLDKLTVAQLAAVQSISGMSSEQWDQTKELVTRLKTVYQGLTEGSAATRKELAKQYGLIEDNGQLRERETDKLIESFTDFYLAANSISEKTSEQNKLLGEQRKTAKGVREETEAQTKRLEAVKDEIVQQIGEPIRNLVKKLPEYVEKITRSIDNVASLLGGGKPEQPKVTTPSGKPVTPAAGEKTRRQVAAAAALGVPGAETVEDVMRSLGIGASAHERFMQAGSMSAEAVVRPSEAKAAMAGDEELHRRLLEKVTAQAIWEAGPLKTVYQRVFEGEPAEAMRARQEQAIREAEKTRVELLKKNPAYNPLSLALAMANRMQEVLAGPQTKAGDFVVTDRGEVIKADPRDMIMGFRPGAGAGPGGPGAVYVNIYGGNRREVYQTVRDALRIARVATA